MLTLRVNLNGNINLFADLYVWVCVFSVSVSGVLAGDRLQKEKHYDML